MSHMRPLKALLLIYALLLTFVSIVEMKDFCDSFIENNYRISYGFRRIVANKRYFHYIFIDQYYWQLFFTDSINPPDTKISFKNTSDGQKSNWFGKAFSTAFCVWDSNEKKCKTMLFSFKEQKIVCAYLKHDLKKLDLNGSTDTVERVSIKEDAILGFVPKFHDRIDRFVQFITKTDSGYDYLLMRARKDCILENTIGLTKEFLDPIQIKQLDKSLDLMAVFGQFMSGLINPDFPGMILLFKGNKSVVYCTAIAQKFHNCQPNELRTLIDCSGYIPKSIVNPPKDDESISILVWFGIAIIAIIVLMAAIVAVLWYTRTSKSEEPTDQPKQAMARPIAQPKQAMARPIAKPKQAMARPIAKPLQANAKPTAKPLQANAKPTAKPLQAKARPRAKAHKLYPKKK